MVELIIGVALGYIAGLVTGWLTAKHNQQKIGLVAKTVNKVEAVVNNLKK